MNTRCTRYLQLRISDVLGTCSFADSASIDNTRYLPPTLTAPSAVSLPFCPLTTASLPAPSYFCHRQRLNASPTWPLHITYFVMPNHISSSPCAVDVLSQPAVKLPRTWPGTHTLHLLNMGAFPGRISDRFRTQTHDPELQFNRACIEELETSSCSSSTVSGFRNSSSAF
jgi:hypothetical protein